MWVGPEFGTPGGDGGPQRNGGGRILRSHDHEIEDAGCPPPARVLGACHGRCGSCRWSDLELAAGITGEPHRRGAMVAASSSTHGRSSLSSGCVIATRPSAGGGVGRRGHQRLAARRGPCCLVGSTPRTGGFEPSHEAVRRAEPARCSGDSGHRSTSPGSFDRLGDLEQRRCCRSGDSSGLVVLALQRPRLRAARRLPRGGRPSSFLVKTTTPTDGGRLTAALSRRFGLWWLDARSERGTPRNGLSRTFGA